MYADCEALLRLARDRHEHGHNSFNYESQSPSSVGYIVVSVFHDIKRDYRSPTGEQSERWFLHDIREQERVAMECEFDEKLLVMNRFDQISDSAKICTDCKQPFLPDNSKKVTDHDQEPDQDPGAACRKCNLMARRTCKIPIFFHNFPGYDSHFVTQALRRWL